MTLTLRRIQVATPVSAQQLDPDAWLMFQTFARELYRVVTQSNGGIYIVAKSKGDDDRLKREMQSKFPGRFRLQEEVV